MTWIAPYLLPEGPGAIQPVLYHVVMIGTDVAEPIPPSLILLRDEHPMLARLWLVGHYHPFA